MCQCGWRALVCTAALAATAGTQPMDSGSDEELRQAMVLVEMLKFAITRRPSPVSPAVPAVPPSIYVTAGPGWPPPYDASFYGNGERREMSPPFVPRSNYESDFGGVYFPGRRFANASRQLQYDDPFGPHPGGDGQDNGKDPTLDPQQSSKVPLMLDRNTTTSPQNQSTPKAATETTETTTVQTAITTPYVTTNTANTLVKKKERNIAESDQSKIDLSSSHGNRLHSATTTEILKLNHNKNRTNIPLDMPAIKQETSRDRGNEPEVEQAASELEREVSDVKGAAGRVQYCRGTFPDRSTAELHGDSASQSSKQPQYPRSIGQPGYRGSTRVHLSRSSRPGLPLPENNAFCFTNPESPLCRTFI